jgi:type III secretion protein W
MKEDAAKYEQKNPELKAKVLMLLREKIKPGDTEEDILKKLEEFYSDPSLADEALDFLLDTTEGELHQTVQKAKDMLNETKGREITAGRNISEQARAAAEKGLGTPTSMRDMYRDITGNPRDAQTLFSELSQKYAFKELTKVTNFLFHSLGADMKAKGASIPRGELSNLMAEVRTLQAIMGVYRFFKGRMSLMSKLFASGGLTMPESLTFEAMAKAFMNLAAERYPNADKVKSQARTLDIEDWILAKIIAFSQFRDSVRELAMSQIYRNLQHRDELFLAIIEALEDLEEELEEDEEEEGEKEAWEGDELEELEEEEK